MKKALASILASVVLCLGTALPAHAGDNVVLVELFTSQGCSSCPPADRNLAKLEGRDDVLGLSFHVDYWDYLGWRDTFARREHTRRQIRYRGYLGLRVVYTPQMVVHGVLDVVGSRLASLEKAIAKARAVRSPAQISITAEGGMLRAHLSADPPPATGGVWMASFARERKVEISHGENAGTVQSYHNVVDKLMHLGRWDGSKQDVSLPQPGPGNGVAIWIQDEKTGRILAASYVKQ